MMEYWNERVVQDIATGVSGATMGVIPIPLVKAIICLGICAAESAVDLNYIKSGLPIVFFKNKEKKQLFIKFKVTDKQAFVDQAKNKSLNAKDMFSFNSVKIPQSEIYFSYSDYLHLFLFIELCAVEDHVYYRLSDVIQTNMSYNTELDSYDESGFKMCNAKTYFEIVADKIRVKPMMISLPYAQQYDVKELLDKENWNTFSYKATRGY